MKDTTLAIDRAIQAAGSQQLLADALGIKQPTVSEWKTGARPVPVERCVEIEVKFSVPVEDLRPDIKWHRVKDKSWPCGGGRPLADFAKAEA